MDKIAEIFDNGKKINVIKGVAVEALGAQQAEEAWRQARELLAAMLGKYPEAHPKEQAHTDLIFPHIAVYKALLAVSPDKAMKIMEQGEAITAQESAKTFQKIVKVPFGKALFMKGFAAGCESGFGTDAGFSHVVHRASAREYKMDITACPYAKYCTAEGCPELTHIFCDNDVYAYGNLQGIRFTRTQTLGTGGDKCDFHLVRGV